MHQDINPFIRPEPSGSDCPGKAITDTPGANMPGISRSDQLDNQGKHYKHLEKETSGTKERTVCW